MRHADDRRLRHLRHFLEQVLHLLGVDVVAAGDDDVLRASDDGDAPLGVHEAHVPGAEETVRAELLRGLLRHAPVAGKDVRAADLDLADGAGCERFAVLRRDARLYARQGESHGPRHALAVERVRGVHQRLRHAVTLQDAVAGAGLEGVEGLFRERRGTGDEQAHVGAGLPAEVRARQQPCVESGHAHRDRRTGEVTRERLRVEPRQEHHRSARQQDAVHRHEQAVHVKDRQRVEQHVVIAPAPGVAEGLGVARQVAVGQHRAFRAPGRAGGVDDRGEVSRGPFGYPRDRASRTHGIRERPAPRSIQSGDRDTRSDRGSRTRHEQRGFRVRQEVLHLPRRVGRVERHVNSPCLQAAEVQGNGLGRLRGLHDDSVARFHAERGQRAGRGRHPGLQLRVRPVRPVRKPQARLPAACPEPALEAPVEVAAHAVPSSLQPKRRIVPACLPQGKRGALNHPWLSRRIPCPPEGRTP